MSYRITTRPSTLADASLLFTLFAEDKAAEFGLSGLSAAQIQPLLEMQYRNREFSYSQRWIDPADSILSLADGTPVGRMLVDRQPDCYRVMNLAVLRAYRNRGIGGESIRRLQAAATREALPVRLRVMKGASAERLYRRLGFEAISSDDVSTEIQWEPVTSGTIHAAASLPRLSAAVVVLLFLLSPSLHAQAVLSVTPKATASTVAGTGAAGYSGDSGAAAGATFASPGAVAYDADGNLFIADTGNNVIREVSASGIVRTVAGNGQQGFSGDGAPATGAKLNAPTGIAIDENGNLYIADSRNNRIREVSNGIIHTVAGSGSAGYSGDGGAAVGAELDLPMAVAFDFGGNLYIADTDNQRVREVSGAVISTVAGDGEQGYGGDGGPAIRSELDTPTGIAVDASGNLYIADSHNNRVRKVSSGVISTVAGSGPAGLAGGYSGDGGSSTAARLAMPSGIAVDAAENIYIADTNNNRLREVGNGGISTVAGTGIQGYGGDGGAATSAVFDNLRDVAVSAAGNAVIADGSNERVRSVNLPTLVFASQGAGAISSPQYVTIANSGSGTLTVQSLNATGDFTVVSGGACPAPPISLSAGESCTQAIAFEPASAGESQGSLVVSASGVPPETILLSGGATRSAAIPQLSSSLNPAAYGAGVTFTATVGAGSTPAPTGSMTFYDGSNVLGVVAMSTGSASYSTSALGVGVHSITAAYSGDSAWEPKTSSILTQTIAQGTPSITLTASSSAVLLANPITLTAIVSSSGGAPSGTVTFLDGTQSIASADLIAGQATVTVSTLAVGAHSITAIYSGSAGFTSVSSAAVSEQVEDFSFSLATGSVTSVSVAPGGTAVYKLVISPVGATAFPQVIQLSAVGLPPGAIVGFSPANIAAGSGATTVTFTIQQRNTSAALQLPGRARHRAPLYLGLALLPFAEIRRNRLIRGAADRKRRNRRGLRTLLMMAVLSLAAPAGITGCGYKTGYFAQPSQNYTVTITGTAGALSRSATVQLNVK